jgi:hypothetical protein
MSVPRPSPTDEIMQALRTGLRPFLAENDPLRRILIGAQAGEREALPVFAVGLKDVAAGTWQQGREFVGWRFLAVDAHGNGIVVNVTAPAAGHPPRVAGVQRGRHVAKTIEAVRAVQAPPDAAGVDVELTFLNIPGLLTETFWIRTKAHGDGWAVPYRTLIDDLKQKPIYTLNDFFNQSKQLAADRLQQDDGI